MKTKELLKHKSPYILITGEAGSGKTFLVREAMNLNPKWGVLSATTGVAALVLGTNVIGGDVKTIHSTLGFFDAESLEKSRAAGTLAKNLKRLRKRFKRIVIDESSMLDSRVFEILVPACEEAGIGIVLTGDFLQLPAVPPKTPQKTKAWEPWLFNTEAFKKFSVIRLDTQHRQTNPDFINALNCLRIGDGESAVPHLKAAGVTFVDKTFYGFQGTTITGKKETMEAINEHEYAKLPSEEQVYTTVRTGHPSANDLLEWEDIPDTVNLKLGTRVMILRNLYGEKIVDPMKKVDTDAADYQTVLCAPDGSTGVVAKDKNNRLGHALLQSNGDTGVVTGIGATSVDILRDDGATVTVNLFTVDNGKYHTEIGDKGERVKITDKEPTAWVNYLPVRKAWAINAHKVQGLTIEHPTRVLIRDMFGPAMVYVSISRVKNPKDLTLVGAEEVINGETQIHWKTKMAPAVGEWK
jgi:ATP-dependent DNA helicase PIF1